MDTGAGGGVTGRCAGFAASSSTAGSVVDDTGAMPFNCGFGKSVII